jgi:hypothetical protein
MAAVPPVELVRIVVLNKAAALEALSLQLARMQALAMAQPPTMATVAAVAAAGMAAALDKAHLRVQIPTVAAVVPAM